MVTDLIRFKVIYGEKVLNAGDFLKQIWHRRREWYGCALCVHLEKEWKIKIWRIKC